MDIRDVETEEIRGLVLDGALPREQLDDWCRTNWNRIPKEQRLACIIHLNEQIPAVTISLMHEQHSRGLRIGSHAIGFHFWYGMAVRNMLRDIMLDDALPEVEQSDGSMARNWDDFYTGALEELAETKNQGRLIMT